MIFATDIDSHAIAVARAGIYPASIAVDLTPERLAHFFSDVPGDNAYRIRKSIRDMLVFSEQNVIKDPPFSKLDLISCRNLLIYLDGDLQKKLIPLFHYALNPGGYLFLGTSETIGEFGELFETRERKQKIYQHKEGLSGDRYAGQGRFLPSMTLPGTERLRIGEKIVSPRKIPLRELTEQALLQQIVQAGALVNAQGDILYIHGRTGMYLEPFPGESEPSNILKMSREGLRRDLTTALHKVVQSRETVLCSGVRVKTNGDFTTVNLIVRPVTAGLSVSSESPLFLIILEQVPEVRNSGQLSIASGQDDKHLTKTDGDNVDARITALKRELQAKEEYLQTANEELETSNEELKSSNEEMQSVNEELQSTNEELETSKEELQSVNEELATVNVELQTKVVDLSRANNDMNNLLAGTGIATVFVDIQLRILRFTPAATKIINLIQSDIGRPVGHIVSNLPGYESLTADVQAVLDTLIPRELDVQTYEGRWFTMRIQPYRTIDNVIEGVVITFVDITEMRKLQVETSRKKLRGENIMNDKQHDSGQIFADKAVLRKKAEEQVGTMESIIQSAQTPEEIQRVLHELRVHQIELEMQNEELRMAQAEIEAGRARYFDLYDMAPVGYCTLSEQGLILEANLTAATLLGVSRSALVRQPFSRFIIKEDQDISYLHRKQLFEKGEPRDCELRLLKSDGALICAHLTGTVVKTEDGTFLCRMVINDITDRKKAEAEQDKLQAELTQANKMESVGRLAGGVAHDFNNMLGIILGYTEQSLNEIGPDDPLHDNLEEIGKAARRSADLTRQLMAFARKQTIAPKVLDLNDKVAGMLKMPQRLIGEEIIMDWKPAQGLWLVKMDPAQMDQILANLCVNAQDAISGVGRITVETDNIILDEIYCARHDGFIPGEYVLLSVSDDGCGMDAEMISHLFEPFFTTKEMGKGTGLGLSTVYGAVKQNNGFLCVISEPTQGTKFRVYLPRHGAEAPSQAKEYVSSVTVPGTETVLLVDDDPAVLKMTAKMLEMLGYSVLATSIPGEAVQLAQKHSGRIDLLLTDVVMPEMNGRDLAKDLLFIYPNIQRLFMSGYTSDIIANRGVLDANAYFLQKPFSLNELGVKLREALKER